MKADGKSDAEIDAFKKREMKQVEESLKEMELKSKRYQRDILTIWGLTAFEKVSESQGNFSENKKLQELFKLRLNTPKGVDYRPVYQQIIPAMAGGFTQQERFVLDEINRQFGVDFLHEWNELNDAIGDTGASVDDFYDSLEYVLKNTKAMHI